MLPSIEYTNTLANGIVQYAKDADRKLENGMAIEASKIRAEMKDDTPDWGQNNSEGKGFIKNRPFYTEEPPIITNLGNTFDVWDIIWRKSSVNEVPLSFVIEGGLYRNVVPKYFSSAYVYNYVAGEYQVTVYTQNSEIKCFTAGKEVTNWQIVSVSDKEIVHKIPEKYYDAPTKTSQLTNDSGYLTEHQSLEAYAKKTEIPTVPTSLKNPNV